MFIKTLKKDVVDVFLGKGWNQWVRLSRTQCKEGTIIKQTSGTYSAPPKVIDVLKNKVKWV